MTAPKETHCDGCGAGYIDVHRHLVDVEDAAYVKLAKLCRGRSSEPKTPCLDKWIKARKLECVVCGGELYRHKANFRARPVCRDCEVRIQALNAKDQPKRWFALDTYAAFGVPIPSGVHADYVKIGEALLAALGSAHRDGPWEERLVSRERKDAFSDPYVNGTVELTAEQWPVDQAWLSVHELGRHTGKDRPQWCERCLEKARVGNLPAAAAGTNALDHMREIKPGKAIAVVELGAEVKSFEVWSLRTIGQNGVDVRVGRAIQNRDGSLNLELPDLGVRLKLKPA